ncbi:MAG: Crp/Fnr family transcriptional regulator [Fulvivirga sp.]|uniref:Crp/Fnr family transcriptional regulator n=1 Tax=Fulvivirga sp. TaxID=1931237 RepID=UPI0032EF1872
MKDNILYENFSLENYSDEERQLILSSFKKINFKKGEFLLKEGQKANAYWMVQEGFVRSYLIDFEGNDVSTYFYSPPDVVIDWPSFFMHTPTKEYIQALTDCVCWELDFETFQQLFHSIEEFRERGRARLVKSYFDLKRHSTSLITDQAKERYLRLVEEKPEIIQNVSLKHIASYLGMKAPSLSRIRKEMSGGNS